MEKKLFVSSSRRKISLSSADLELYDTLTAKVAGRLPQKSGLWDYIFQDAPINSPKIKCFLALFRGASYFEQRKSGIFYRALYYPVNACYCLFADLFVGGAELPAGTRVGRNLTIHHGYGLVIGKEVRIDDDVILRQGVTIGNYVNQAGQLIGNPVIGSHTEFGAGACVLGDAIIGERAFIGANTVVYKDVPPGARVYPGRCLIREATQDDEPVNLHSLARIRKARSKQTDAPAVTTDVS